MIQKQELRELILRNQYTFGSDSQSICVRNYERNKEELAQELLDHYHKGHRDKFQNRMIDRPATKLHLNKTQPLERKAFSIFQQEQQQNEVISRISLNDYFSKKPRLDQYISNRTPREKPPNYELAYIEKYLRNSDSENQSILNSFLVPQAEHKLNKEIQQIPCLTGCRKVDNIKWNNQSTLVMSKQGKQSPHKSLRFTERSIKSKSSSQQHHYQKSPFKLSISKVSEIEVRGAKYGTIRQNIKKDETLNITLTPKSQQNQRFSTYSVSNINKTAQISSMQEDIEPFEQIKDNGPKLLTAEENIIPKRFQDNKVQKNSSFSSKKIPKDKLLKIKLELLEEKEEDSKVSNYDYDREPNIFDHFKNEQNAQRVNPVELTGPKIPIEIGYEEIKDVWHIKDKKKFNEEIQKQSQIFKQRSQPSLKKKESKKQSVKLFDKNPENHFKSIKSDLIKKNKETEEDLQENGQVKEEKFQFLNFLKDKLTNLVSKTQPQQKEKEVEKYERQSDLDVQPSKEEKKSHSQTIKSDLSYQSSSSSFFKQKKNIQLKGYKNVDVANFVGQSIKIVSVNLEKMSNKIKQKPQSSCSKSSSKISNSIQKKKSNLKEEQQQVQPHVMDPININPTDDIDSVFCKNANNIHSELQSSRGKGQQNQNEKEINLSVDFFAGSRPRESDSSFSKPSTVQKIDSNSDDKSQIFHQLNFSIHKDDSVNQQLFPLNKKGEDVTQKVEVHSSQSELNPSFKTSIIQPPKKIQIDLKCISLSQDAISFSKLQSIESERSIKGNNVQILNQNNQEHLSKQDKERISSGVKKDQIYNELPKPGKVRRIEIDLDESQSDEDIYGESDSEGIDLDNIKDYDSDEEQNSNSEKNISKIPKDNKPSVLLPVVEQDLEESELKNQIKPSISLKQRSSDSDQRSRSIKELQEQFLKDFPLAKAESQVQSYKSNFTFKKNNLSKEVSEKEKTKIRLKPTQSKLINLEESKKNERSFNSLEDISEKQLLDSLKDDVEKLKNKIESSVILDTSKINSRPSKKKVSSNTKQISLDLNQKSCHNIQSSSLSKMFEDDSSSILAQKSKIGDTSKIEIRNRDKIDFDQIDQQNGKQLFKGFRQDLKNLKKKIRDDVINEL